MGTTTVTVTASSDCGEDDCTFTVTVYPTTLSGNVSYFIYADDNVSLEGIDVYLWDENDDLIASGTTDGSGNFEFRHIPNGEVFAKGSNNVVEVEDEDFLAKTKHISVSTDREHGGMSAIDALAIQRRVVGLGVSYWQFDDNELVDDDNFLSHVGNVWDTDWGLETVDAAWVQYRSIFPNTQFHSGDWAFYSRTQKEAFVNGNNQAKAAEAGAPVFESRIAYDGTFSEIKIESRAHGDVRGSYRFVQTKSAPVSFQTDEIMKVSPGEEFILPITLQDELEFNAMMLEINYDASRVEVLDVKSEIPGLLHNVEDDVIIVSWQDLHAATVNADEAVVELKVRAKGDILPEDDIFRMGDRTEFGDAMAETIEGFKLGVSRLTTRSEMIVEKPEEMEVNLSVFPNPFNDQLNLEYQLESPSHVRVTIINTMGATVATLIDEQQGAGYHEKVFHPDASRFQNGIYLLRMEAVGEESTFTRVVRLSFLR